MARIWYRSHTLTRQTTASTSYEDVVDLTVTPTPSTDYFLLWSTQFDLSATSSNGRHRLRDDTAGANVANPVHRAPNTEDIMSAGGIARWTSGASPGPQTFSVEHSVDSVSTTVGSGDAYLMAIVADTTDAYAESTDSDSTTSSTLADKVTLNYVFGAAWEDISLRRSESYGGGYGSPY